MESVSWQILDKYFTENTHNLVAHHLDSYNDFFSSGINNIFKDLHIIMNSFLLLYQSVIQIRIEKELVSLFRIFLYLRTSDNSRTRRFNSNTRIWIRSTSSFLLSGANRLNILLHFAVFGSCHRTPRFALDRRIALCEEQNSEKRGKKRRKRG